MTTQRQETVAVGARLGWGERLGGLVLKFQLSDGDSVLWRDERFVEWLARRARKRAEAAPHSRENDAPGTVGLRGACSRRFGIRVYEGPPPHAGACDRITPPTDLPDGDYVALRDFDNGMSPLLGRGDTILVLRGGSIGRDNMVVAGDAGDMLACRRVVQLTRSWARIDALVPGSGSARVVTRDAIVGPVVAVWVEPRPAAVAARPNDGRCRRV